jgi:hypothetical protein
LDQDKCTEYLVEIGSISCLDYVKNILHFEWTPQLCSVAARSGRIDVLKHLLSNKLNYAPKAILLECTKGTCDLSMIKYLHENGAPWHQIDARKVHGLSMYSFEDINDHNNTHQTVMENMAYHGHLECMKYALENGCSQRELSYTPSIECLDFAIENGFNWQGEQGSLQVANAPPMPRKPSKRNICEEAARLGDLTMLKYAHQKGALLNNSSLFAARFGHFDCLVYVLQAGTTANIPVLVSRAKTMECFKHLVQLMNLNETTLQQRIIWLEQVKIGNMEILRYMLENKFALPHGLQLSHCWSEATMSFEILKFLLDEVKLPIPTINAYINCVIHGNLEGLKLALERDLPNPDPAPLQLLLPSYGPPNQAVAHVIRGIFRKAIRSNNIEMVKFVWDKFLPSIGDTALCLENAAEQSTPEILDFLTQHGAQWTWQHLSAAAMKQNLPNLAFLTRIGCK